MKQRKNRTLIIAALVIALASTTVAYAALQTTLNITGSITRKGGTWGIQFENLSCIADPESQDNFGEVLENYPVVNTVTASGTSLNFSGSLASVGDKISCTFDLHNTGTLSAINSSAFFEATYSSGNGSFSNAEEDMSLIDDGFTKCWLTYQDEKLSTVADVSTGIAGFPDSPFTYLKGEQIIRNLGIVCQYYNLDTSGTSSFNVSLDLNYVQR